MKTVCIVQARLSSTRLPGKVLMDLAGKPVLQHVLERAADIKGVDLVVLAVPLNEASTFYKMFGDWQIVGGSLHDVLSRYHDAAKLTEADTIVRVTGDCPMLDTYESARLLKAFTSYEMDYADNVSEMADGLDTEVFTRSLLDEAANSATDPYDREHVTPWMRRNARRRLHLPPRSLPAKWSIDTIEDLERVRQVMS